MKFWFGIFFLLLTRVVSAQVKFDLKKDFKAKGDGKSDDTHAFLDAAKRINGLKRGVTLLIPAGQYLVQPQIPSSPEVVAPFIALDLVYLKDCKDITILGEKGATIRYKNGLYYGAFRRNERGFEKLPFRTADWKYRVAIGHGFNLENCKNITIRTIEIDGNNRSFILGGEFGDVGRQIDNDGVFIRDCSDISLSSLYFHHFGRDGLLVLNKTPLGFNTPSQNIKISNCRFEYNGRQGFSWGGGSGFMADSCSFSYTGKSVLSSSPGAGVDFEPNAGYIVKDGKFNNCKFVSNRGVAVISDEGGFNVANVQLNDCTISGETSAAVWIKSPGFVFTRCKINGTFYYGCVARNESEGTKFIQCIFTDLNSNANYLVESNGSKYLFFDGCTFRAGVNGLFYISANASKIEERAVMRNCRFVAQYKKIAKANAFSTGVIYTGKTSFIDSALVTTGINVENSWFLGSKEQKTSITIGGHFGLGSYDKVVIGDNKNEVQVNVENNGLLSMSTNSHLIIGEKGQVLLKKGGTLWLGPGSELIIKGKIIAEEGAYLCIHQGAILSNKSRENIVLEGGVNFSDNPKMKYGLAGCITISK
jgi:hypothetical protein